MNRDKVIELAIGVIRELPHDLLDSQELEHLIHLAKELLQEIEQEILESN